MYTFTDPVFWLSFVWFCSAAILVFIIPPAVLLNKLNLKGMTFFGVAIPLGISLWGWQGYIFGYLHIRWASYIYVAIFAVIWFIKYFRKLRDFRNIRKEVKENRNVILLIITGVFAQMTMKWFTFMRWGGRPILCCSDTADDIWYTSIVMELVRKFPPAWPGLGDIPLTNYHYWSNLVVADMARVFGIPVIPLQFQFMPLLLSLTLGLSLYGFSKIIGLPAGYTRWLLIFVYLGGDAISWLLLFLGKGMNFSMSSLEDGVRFLGNLPRAYAVTVFFGAVNLWLVWWCKKRIITTVLIALMAASLSGLKIYFGIFFVMGIGFTTLLDFYYRRTSSLILFILSVIFTLIVYLPANTQAGGLFYTGFWTFENFIMQPALKLERLEMARIIFANDRKWFRVLGYDLLFFALYNVSIFGSKLIGLIQDRKSLRHFPFHFHMMIAPPLMISFILGGFFQQNVGGSNTFNFLALFFIIISFYTALSAWYWTQIPSTLRKIALTLVILVLTLPRSIHVVSDNLITIFKHRAAVVSLQTEEYANYIKANTPENAVILVNNIEYPVDRGTTIVHMLTDRKMYLSGLSRLEVVGADTNDREKIHDNIFMSPNPVLVARLLLKSPIDYLLATSSASFASTDSAKFIDPVYHNEYATLYKVSRDKISQYLSSGGAR